MHFKAKEGDFDQNRGISGVLFGQFTQTPASPVNARIITDIQDCPKLRVIYIFLPGILVLIHLISDKRSPKKEDNWIK